mmetsp:Transcript_41597/g.138341  ORF Transcript_41597/g.138341 Transcript_41597/m.138341 type:complete len:138 (+) Transcript_41597:39-452(+)
MRCLVLFALVVGAVSALVVAPPAAVSSSARVAAGPVMACNGGKGGNGGKNPPKDKTVYRPKLSKLIQRADSAENVKSVLLTAQTEAMLLKMNWKYRRAAAHQVRKRAAQFGVEVPGNFAAFNVRPRNAKKHLLVPSM